MGAGDIDDVLKQSLSALTQSLSTPLFQQPDLFSVNNLGGDVVLGRDAVNGVEVGLRLRELGQHMLIAGRTGSGKTSLIYWILLQLLRLGVPFWAFDFKNDYRHLLPHASRAGRPFLVFGPSAFAFNPLRPPPGVRPKEWIQVFVQVFGFSFYILAGGSSLLVDEITKLYQEYGVFAGSDTYPCVLDLLDAFEKLRGRNAFARSSPREKSYFEACYNRLKQLSMSLGELLGYDRGFPVEELLKSNVVLELQGLLQDNETFLINMLLAYIFQYKVSRNLKSPLAHVFVFDEAKKVYNRSKEQNSDLGISPVMLFTSMIRAFGEGIVVADQIPSELGKSIRDNVHTMVCLGQSGGDSVSTMEADMRLSREQADFSQQLSSEFEDGFFEGIVRFPKFPQPFVVRFPFTADVSKQVSGEEISVHMKEHWQQLAQHIIAATSLAKLRQRAAEQAREQEAQKESLKEPEKHAEPEVERVSAVDEPPIEERGSAGDGGVEGNLLVRFLTHVRDFPFMDVTRRYADLGIASTAVGDKVRDEVIGKGYANAVLINRGYKKGNVALFEITDAGRQFARMDKAEVPGKGGFEHKYWQHIIREHYAKLGWFASIEKDYEGKSVDVGLEKDGARVAVEVELTDDNLLVNVEKDLQACDRIIICVRSEKAKKTFTDAVVRAFGAGVLQRLSFEVLGSFIE